MAKSKKRSFSRPGVKQAKETQKPLSDGANSAPKRPDRRTSLKRFRNGALLMAGLGTGSFYIGSSVLAGIEEGDLTQIGNGKPTIVQIHDPQCPTCRALQREARLALEKFDEGQLQYLVANIRKEDGKALAAKHRVQHVTLLLLDGAGRRSEVITGLTKSAYLEQAFRRHLRRAGKG
ncbi:MAG: hypothetical protein AB8C46_04840 [Burkholderiaceae bacterium]